ncbi:MAG: IS3 family transposase, partial [Candidatus Saccharibacteria bacterium]|nr:IS3 family transposase [Microbacteriaceae bacterium]
RDNDTGKRGVIQGEETNSATGNRGRNTEDRREAPRGRSSRPKRIHPVVDHLIEAGYRAKQCCRLLGVSSPGYYRYKNRPLSPTQMRRLWLTGLISEVHIASRQTYGSRRIHAELTIGMKVQVSERLVAVLMSKAGIRGLPGPAKVKRLHGIATADDLVHRKFHRLSPNELWITDITEHRTREGKFYCCAVMDKFSRKIVGWSIDNSQDSALVVNALDMAIKNRQPSAGGIVHADHGVQFTSWAFTNKIRSSGLMPSFGTIGDCYDNAMIESFWSSMQIELLNRKKWRTQLDLANAIFDYIEIFYNRQRRHSQLKYLSPVEHELRFTQTPRHPYPPDLQTKTGNQTVGHVKMSTIRAADPSFGFCPRNKLHYGPGPK